MALYPHQAVSAQGILETCNTHSAAEHISPSPKILTYQSIAQQPCEDAVMERLTQPGSTGQSPTVCLLRSSTTGWWQVDQTQVMAS